MITFVDWTALCDAQSPAKTIEEIEKEFREQWQLLPFVPNSREGDEQQNCFDRHAGYETLVLEWRDCQ